MPFYHAAVRWLWYAFGALILGIIVMFIIISTMNIPSFSELENPHSALASEVIASNGEVLGRYYIENRVPVDYKDLSPYLVSSLVATEDERFWKHSGIDIQSVARVIVRTILMQDQSAGGGSTITQQLAKMLYSDRDFSGMSKFEKMFHLFYKKFREWITAVKLERAYTKEEIIAMYLNQFNFINNAYGIRAAAEIYYGKSQKDLTVEESALLIGMLKNPSLYNPLRFDERAIRRRMVVLNQMQKNGLLSEMEYDSLKLLPLDLRHFKRETPADDRAPYFCMSIREDLKKILAQKEHLKPDGTKYDIFKDGLKIFTTIDPTYQRYAEEAVREHMAKQQKTFFKVWKGRDPWTYRIEDRDGDGTTDREIEIRQAMLENIMKNSERYDRLRNKYMNELEKETASKYADFTLRDADIDRMLQAERDKKYLDKLKKKGWTTDRMDEVYRDLIKTELWQRIKHNYRNLQSALIAQFRKKVPMKVFSYNANSEADTLLSPLDSIKYHRMHLQTGVLAIEPQTGYVKAWVGGIDYKYYQYDHIRTDRQVGSTFKPFVYATAISQHDFSPCSRVYDQPVTIPAGFAKFTNLEDWTPKNAKNRYSGRAMTLKEALKESVNSVSAYLMKQLGDPDPVRGLAHNMGIDSSERRSNGQYRIPKQPSICLGASDLSVLDMTGAYATFANNGVYNKPTFILRIEDKQGRVIYRASHTQNTALSPESNYAMLDMLKYAAKGKPGIRELESEVGGKTGTTNDYSDGWFMGVTPSLVVGTWVGGDDRWVRFLSLDDGQGARMARPIFTTMMKKLEDDPKSGYNVKATFKKPPGDSKYILDCSQYDYGDEEEETESSEGFYEDIFNSDPNATTPVPAPDGTTPLPPQPKKKEERFGEDIFGEGNR